MKKTWGTGKSGEKYLMKLKNTVTSKDKKEKWMWTDSPLPLCDGL